jgi:hypothetical protein
LTLALCAPGPAARAAVRTAVLALIVSGCQAAPSSGGADSDPVAGVGTSTLASAPADLDPDDLSGIARTELTELLGAADFDRRDGPAEILQYRNGTCILDVFLYRESTDESFRVAHVEARDLEMQKVPGIDCLRSLSKTRQYRAG